MAEGDASALRALASELEGQDGAWVRPLQFRVIASARKAEMAAKSKAAPALPVSLSSSSGASGGGASSDGWWQAWNLPEPDGRPLWQYRVPVANIGRIEAHLVRTAGLGMRNRVDCALFVIWAAERFRSSWQGEHNRWKFLAVPLGLPWQNQMDGNRLRAITDRGLELWNLQALVVGQGRLRADMLVRQGGFPVAAVDADAGGLVTKWLELLVGHAAAQADPDPIALASLAQQLLASLPSRWQSNFFAELGADLAVAIVKLRQEAEAKALPGIPVSAWLDQNRPNWRDDLPVSIDGDAGRRLVDGLMKVEAKRLRGKITAAWGYRRMLSGWETVVRLNLDGALQDKDGLIDAGWRRLRLRACGSAARWLPGDLAVAEAADGAWDLVPARVEQAVAFPTSESLTCQFVGGGDPVGTPFRLVDPLRSKLIVCASSASDEGDDLPDELVVVGTGSGAYRSPLLWLLVPCDWEPNGGMEFGEGPDQRKWWRIASDSRVTTPDGDVYLVRPGQSQDKRDTIEVIADNSPHRLVAVEGLPIWQGHLNFFIRDGGKVRSAPADALWWRRPGGPWQIVSTQQQLPPGRVDIGWREDGLLRARDSGIVLPNDFSAKVDGNILTIGSAPSAKVEGAISAGDGRWRLPAAVLARGRTTIDWNGIQLTLRVPTREAIAGWDGRPLPVGGKVYLAELDKWVARFDGPGAKMTLMAHVEDHNQHILTNSEASWTFAEDLPLSAIAGEIASLLRPAGLGCRVALNFNNGIDELWYVHEYRDQLEHTPAGLIPREAFIDEGVLLAGRPLYQPDREEVICPCSLEVSINHRPMALPRFDGQWIVYLKRHSEVLSQPQVVGSPPVVAPAGELAAAMAIGDRDKRFRALEAFASDAEQELSGTAVMQLVQLAASLGRLSPATFDVFTVLAKRPLLAARAALMAPESHLAAVLALAEGLPFLWPLVGRHAWDQAAEVQFNAMLAGLSAYMDEPQAVAEAGRAIVKTRQMLAESEPALAFALRLDNDNRPLLGIANSFLTRSDGRIEPMPSMFRPHLQALLPAWNFGGFFWQALDAPCAAALHAAGNFSLSSAEIRVVRQIANRHPRWFAEGFAAFSRTL